MSTNTATTTTDIDTLGIEALDRLGDLWGQTAAHLDRLANEARDAQRDCRHRSIALRTPPAPEWEWVNLGELRLGDVIQWPGERGIERVMHLGNAGFAPDPAHYPLVEIGTSGMLADQVMCANNPVRVQLPRPVDQADAELCDAARHEQAGH